MRAKRALALAAVSYPVAFLYVLALTGDYTRWQWYFMAFMLGYVLLVELAFWDRPRPGESWVWLICMLTVGITGALESSKVWPQAISLLAAHGLGFWWALSRGGVLLEGRTGSLFLADVYRGTFPMAFGNFFRRAGTVRQGLRGLAPNSLGRRELGWSALGAALGLGLLALSWESLAQADENFRSLTGSLRLSLPQDTGIFLIRLALSLPVGAWIFGLIAGAAGTDREALPTKAAGLRQRLEGLRKVPGQVWTGIMALALVMYLAFFGLQWGYLFGAFTCSLPEGFIVSQYAREGFFELLRAVGINFCLLLLCSRCGLRPLEESRVQRVFASLLLLAGMLLAVVALSKLGLYISCFGFTPRRLQSSWLALVLLAAGAAWLYSLWTGRRSFRIWLAFSALTMALLHLY